MDRDKRKILLYIHNNIDCRRIRKIFNHSFDLQVAPTRKKFISRAKKGRIDLGVICYCYPAEEDINGLVSLKKEVNHIPILVSTKIPDPQFICRSCQEGVGHFVLCQMSSEKIKSELIKTIETYSLRIFIEDHIIAKNESPYTSKIIDLVVKNLPGHLTISELAKKMDLSVRWIQSLVKEIFGMSYTNIMRRVLVYESLNLMKGSNMDNTEIALVLNYSDVNSLNRIFHKELGITPSKARKELINKTPDEILG